MARSYKDEFSPKTKIQAWDRCGGFCEGENCGLPLKAGNRPEYDHIKEVWEGGDNSLENCQVLGSKCCHRSKTNKATTRRAKADRNRKREANIGPRSKFAAARTGKYKVKINGTVEVR